MMSETTKGDLSCEKKVATRGLIVALIVAQEVGSAYQNRRSFSSTGIGSYFKETESQLAADAASRNARASGRRHRGYSELPLSSSSGWVPELDGNVFATSASAACILN
jgi:hypothetical protein